MESWAIEVRDGTRSSASSWMESHRENLTLAAITHRAGDWRWVARPWGVIFEIDFADEADWLRFRGTVAVRAALDGAPDPDGVLIYSGPGGGSASRVPRTPAPHPAAGAVALPEPEPTFAACSLPYLEPAANGVAV